MCFEEKQGQNKQKTHILTAKDACTECVHVVPLRMNVDVTFKKRDLSRVRCFIIFAWEDYRF